VLFILFTREEQQERELRAFDEGFSSHLVDELPNCEREAALATEQTFVLLA